MPQVSWQQFQMMQLLLQQNVSDGKGKGEKGKGKGKGGKGKDGKGQKGKGDSKGKGKRYGNYDDEPGAAEEELLCKCCGKNGHLKKDCWHKDKLCQHCGKGGHLGYMCHATVNRQNDQSNEKQQNIDG